MSSLAWPAERSISGTAATFARPALGEPVHALRDRGPGELDKAPFDRQGRVSSAHEADEVVELSCAARVAAAVADDQERGTGFVSSRSVLSKVDRLPHSHSSS